MVLFTHSFLSSLSSFSSMSYAMKVSVSRPNTSSMRGWAEPCSTAHKLPITIISTSLHVAKRNWTSTKHTLALGAPAQPKKEGRCYLKRQRKLERLFTSWKKPTLIAGCSAFPWPLFEDRRLVSLCTRQSIQCAIAIFYLLLIVLGGGHCPACKKTEHSVSCCTFSSG